MAAWPFAGSLTAGQVAAGRQSDTAAWHAETRDASNVASQWHCKLCEPTSPRRRRGYSTKAPRLTGACSLPHWHAPMPNSTVHNPGTPAATNDSDEHGPMAAAPAPCPRAFCQRPDPVRPSGPAATANSRHHTPNHTVHTSIPRRAYRTRPWPTNTRQHAERECHASDDRTSPLPASHSFFCKCSNAKNRKAASLPNA